MRLCRQTGAIAAMAFLAIALLGTRTSATPESVVAAANANDVTLLEALESSASTAQQRRLAAGTLLELRHKDTAAIATLIPITRSAANRVVRATAYLVLSNVYDREQRYRARYSAIRAALQLSPVSVSQGYRQSMTFSQALAGVKRMRLVRKTPGSLPITDEKAGMIRVPVSIDGYRCGVLVDTGANMSMTSVSVAKRVGIQMVGRPASIGSSTESKVYVRLGIAKRLQIGNAILKNVVFIVLPDAKLGIPRRYRINAIIGLPVWMALGRIDIVNAGAPELRYNVSRSETHNQASQRPNLLLSGLEPLVYVHVRGASKPLRMLLDTGSDHTYFTRNAIPDATALFSHAEPYVWRIGGAGGIMTERRALRLPKVRFTIGGQNISLKDVIVSSRASTTSDGVIGEDIFRQGTGWMMDFETMELRTDRQVKVPRM